MKKRIALGLALLMLFSVMFSGCGGQTQTTETTANVSQQTTAAATTQAASTVNGKIVFMSHRIDLEDFLNSAAAKFHEKYPGAEVEMQTNKDYVNTLKVRISSGEAPDVFLYDASMLPPGQYLADTLIPLDDMGYTNETIKYYDSPDHTFNGKHYGLTMAMMVTGILAKKDTLTSAGITEYPKTLDELYAVADKLKAKGIPAFASMVKNNWPLNNWDTVTDSNITGSYDDYIKNMVNSDAPFTADSPIGKTMAFLRSMLKKGYFDKDMTSSDWDVVRKQMDTVGMLMLANYGIGALEGLKPDQIAFFPLPVDNKGTLLSTASKDYDYGIPKTSKNPDTAKAFIKFMLEESGFADALGEISSITDAKSTNPALLAFMNSNPKFYDQTVQDPNLQTEYTNIVNKAQFGNPDLYIAALLNKDDNLQPIFDKYNKKWADAKKLVNAK